MNSLLAHLSEFTPLQLKDQNTLAYTYNADILTNRNTPNLPLYNVDTQKHSEVKPNFPLLRVGTPNLRQVNSHFHANKISTSSYFQPNPYNVGTHKQINENSHFPSIMASMFQPLQINPNSPQHNIGTHRPSPVYPYHSPVNTDIQQLRVPTHTACTHRTSPATTLIWTGGMQSLLPPRTFTKQTTLYRVL